MAEERPDDLEEANDFQWRSLNALEEPDVEWLAQDIVAYGYVTLVDGLPESGKTAFFTALAAQVTTGEGPFEGIGRDPQKVIYLCREESYERDIKCRVEAAGGDPDMVIFPTKEQVSELATAMSFPEAEYAVKEAIKKYGCGLMVIEPLSDLANPDLNLNVEKDARAFMLSLVSIARETRIAIVVSRHAKKNHRGPLMDLGMGSRAIGAVARIGLVAVQHPKSKDRYFLSTYKRGPANAATTLEFTVEKGKGAPRFVYKGKSDINVEELLKATEDPGKEEARKAAEEWLLAFLKDGPKWVKDIQDAGEKNGYSNSTLWNALRAVAGRHHRHTVNDKPQTHWHHPTCKCNRCDRVRAKEQKDSAIHP